MFITDAQWEVLQPVWEVPRKEGGQVGHGPMPAKFLRPFSSFCTRAFSGNICQKLFGPNRRCTITCRSGARSKRSANCWLWSSGNWCKSRVDLQQCFVDAAFAAAKGGGEAVGLTRKGKGTKIQLMVDAQGIPLAVSLDAADRAESHMVQQTLAWEETEVQPERLIGDKAYDCDALDDALAELGIEMISPHRRNRLPENQTQDGRPLRRYRHRWIVERTIAWLGNHRRLLTRWEKNLSNFSSFTLLGCLMLTLRHLPFC
ncbi:MAG TPA: IS5 family transposase [Candidatus Methylacidiphilales bacterium]|nr:IS5 family transposase [Candidatus Methylacidiphilales bacterium]